MGFINFKVHTNGMGVIAENITKAANETEHALAIQVAKDTEPYVPMLTGSLVDRTQVKGNVIIYPGPYAQYLYYGKLMVDPETGSAWAKRGNSKVLTDRNLVFTRTVHPQAQSHWFEASKAQNLKKWEAFAAQDPKEGLFTKIKRWFRRR